MTIGNQYRIVKQVSSITKGNIWLRKGEVITLVSYSATSCLVRNDKDEVFPTHIDNIAEIVP